MECCILIGMHDFNAKSILTELAEESHYLWLHLSRTPSFNVNGFVIVRIGTIKVQDVLIAGCGRVLMDVVKVDDFKRSIPLA